MSYAARGRALALVGMSVALLTLGSGCADLSAFESLRDEARATATAMEEKEKRLSEIAMGLPEGDPRRAEAQAASQTAGAAARAAGAVERELDAVLQRTKDTGLVGEVGEAIGPLIPAPVRVPLALTAALGVSVAQWWRLRKAAGSIVTGLNTAMREDGGFREAFKRNANVFRATQTSTAKRLVDKVNRGSGARMIGA